MTDRPELRRALTTVADEAAGRIDADRDTDAWRRALEAAAPLLLAVPATAFFLSLLRHFGGLDLGLPQGQRLVAKVGTSQQQIKPQTCRQHQRAKGEMEMEGGR